MYLLSHIGDHGIVLPQLMEEEMKKTRHERFNEKYIIDAQTRCWNWIANISSNGYGIFHWGCKENGQDINVVAHRAAYILLKGEIPADRLLRHKCNNSKCCNPDHMELGTHMDNMRDRDLAGRTAKGENHYKFRQTEPLISAFKALRKEGVAVDEICKQLDCSRNTYYRASRRDDELNSLNKEMRKVHHTAAIIQRAIDNPESFARGERNKHAKITGMDVIEIRKERESGASLIELAKKYNMTESGICAVCKRKTWKHI